MRRRSLRLRALFGLHSTVVVGLLAACNGTTYLTGAANRPLYASLPAVSDSSEVHLALAFDARRMSEAQWRAAFKSVEAVADRFDTTGGKTAETTRYFSWTLSDPLRLSRLSAFFEREAKGWQPYDVTLPVMALRIEMDLPSGDLWISSFGPSCGDRGLWLHASGNDLGHGKALSPESCRELMSILGLAE